MYFFIINFKRIIVIILLILLIFYKIFFEKKYKIKDKYNEGKKKSEFNSIKDIIIKIENGNKDDINKIINFIQEKSQVEDFDKLRIKEELHTYLLNSFFDINLKKNDIEAYKKLLVKNSVFLINNNLSILDYKIKILTTLHLNLYSWIYNFKYKTLGDIINTSRGKGIVICASNDYFHLVKSNIEIFRNVFNSNLPIEIFYNKDLSYNNQLTLMKYKNVYVSDISKYFNNTIIGINRYSIKPFAILASRFEEVILLDADCFYLNDPSILFNDKGYKDKGSLLFKDKTMNPSNDTYNWLKSFIRNPLPETKVSRIWNNKSKFEIESSTVVIHKIKTLFGLLNICKLNEKEIRSKVVYKFVYGDKETFWIGFEMSRQNYYVNQEYTAAIGEITLDKNEKGKLIKKICGNYGNIGHTWNGSLLYWNGHLTKTRNRNKKGIYNGYFIVKDGINRWNETTWEKRCYILEDNQEPNLFNEMEKEIIAKVKYD